MTSALVLLTGIISAVGLLVGGIGVMNIMLISVTERTSEIGVRKAVGARRSDIRVQFLLEAIMLSCIGGFIGIFLGALIAFLVRTLIPAVPAFVSPLWIASASRSRSVLAFSSATIRQPRRQSRPHRLPPLRISL